MPAGRPLKYETADELQEAIDAYFAGDAFVEMGDHKMFAPTISGLALSLDVSTECLRNYGEQEEYSATVRKAKQKVEVSLEQRLAGNNVTGAIFNLKNNFRWKDKQEQEVSGPGGGPQEHKWYVEVVDATDADTP